MLFRNKYVTAGATADFALVTPATGKIAAPTAPAALNIALRDISTMCVLPY
jgi:hypothetical protein